MYRPMTCYRNPMGPLAGLAVLATVLCLGLAAPAAAQKRFPAPTYSSPIAMSADGRLIWVVNPGRQQRCADQH